MDLKLLGKRALVTGSTAGIGFAIARSLAREGARVYVNGRTQERVDSAIKAIQADVPDAHVSGVAADFADASGAETMVGTLPWVDILVNNVGIFEPKPFAEIPDSDWYRFFEVNVMSGEEELGTGHFHLKRVGRTDPRRDGSLRHDQDSTGCHRTRDC